VQILIVVENHLHLCISLQVGLTVKYDPLKHNNKNPHHENSFSICLQNYLLKNKLVFLQKIKIMLVSCTHLPANLNHLVLQIWLYCHHHLALHIY